MNNSGVEEWYLVRLITLRPQFESGPRNKQHKRPASVGLLCWWYYQGMYLLLTVFVVLVVWSLWGFFSSKVEQVAYTVTSRKKGYEIRMYPEHIVAQTTVAGSYQEALSQGFRIVAGYIFGGNTKKERIAMTTPVIEQKKSEAIAMTAPVMASVEGDMRTIAFGMPRSYTVETLPVPTDSRVKIVTVPEKHMAVMRFSWFRFENRVQKKKEQLRSALRRDQIKTKGEVQYAGYSAPGTPPWMTRNEVLIEVEGAG